MDASPRRSLFDLATIGLFLAAILAPTVDRFVRPDEVRSPEREGRTAEPFPPLALHATTLDLFPDRCERWFNDTFGLRDKLLRWNSIEKLEVLRVSPTPKIVLGQDDWLLYAEGRTMRVWRGLDPFTHAELEAWRGMLERNRDRLAERGIDYVFAIGPNKETIYPEKVPARFNRVGPTRLEELDRYLREHSDFRMLDLRHSLLAAKADDVPGDEVYLRDGTHWNARGAHAAYSDLVAALSRHDPGLVPLDAGTIEREPMPASEDSWRYRMWVGDRNPQKGSSWRIVPRPESVPVLEWGPPGTGRVRVTELPSRSPLRVLLLHDSFATYCEPLLAETVSHLAMHWTHRFDANDLEVEKPTVVVHLLVERALVAVPPKDIELKTTPTDRELFEASDASIVAPGTGSLEAWSDAACEPAGEGGATAEFRSPRGLLLLPEVPLVGGAVLRADVTTAVRTSLLLFAESDPATSYVEKASTGVQLAAGRNRVYLRIPPGIRGRLGLRIGEATGKLLVHSVEVRRLPRG